MSNIRTRDALIHSFRAACAASTPGDTLLANPICFAGFMLVMHTSAADALAVVRAMPNSAGFATAGKYLAEIAAEETADTQRPMASGEGR